MVSIRAPARGATHQAAGEQLAFKFQSAPPHGGRPIRPRASSLPSSFNPRPRTGGDIEIVPKDATQTLFQSAPPHGGRPENNAAPMRAFEFQSAPPHGGRHPLASPRRLRQSFNPRPRTGGDTSGCLAARRRTFQSAPPHGGRPRPAGSVKQLHTVSIRAPARGATRISGPEQISLLFQSAPPHGGRRSSARSRSCDNWFQSAPPHGGRPAVPTRLPHFFMFQSAPPHGGRLRFIDDPVLHPRVSIRAPARGATSRQIARTASTGCFNPRPRTGGDEACDNWQRTEPTFQSAPPHGGRPIAIACVRQGY